MYLITDDKSHTAAVQDWGVQSECFVGDEEDGCGNETTVLCHEVHCVCVRVCVCEGV